jgi:hypothetical protein
VVVSKDTSRVANQEYIDTLLQHEEDAGYSSGQVFQKFRENIEKHKKAVLAFFEQAKKDGKKVIGYGASTK